MGGHRLRAVRGRAYGAGFGGMVIPVIKPGCGFLRADGIFRAGPADPGIRDPLG